MVQRSRLCWDRYSNENVCSGARRMRCKSNAQRATHLRPCQREHKHTPHLRNPSGTFVRLAGAKRLLDGTSLNNAKITTIHGQKHMMFGAGNIGSETDQQNKPGATKNGTQKVFLHTVLLTLCLRNMFHPPPGHPARTHTHDQRPKRARFLDSAHLRIHEHRELVPGEGKKSRVLLRIPVQDHGPKRESDGGQGTADLVP